MCYSCPQENSSITPVDTNTHVAVGVVNRCGVTVATTWSVKELMLRLHSFSCSDDGFLFLPPLLNMLPHYLLMGQRQQVDWDTGNVINIFSAFLLLRANTTISLHQVDFMDRLSLTLASLFCCRTLVKTLMHSQLLFPVKTGTAGAFRMMSYDVILS